MPKANIIVTPVKNLIVAAKLEGKTDREVARTFKVAHSVVWKVYSRFCREGNVSRLPKSGRPRKSDERQDQALVRVVRNDPTKSATDVVDKARRAFGIKISKETARRILRRYLLFARRPARKPMTLARHRLARLEFAQAHKSWSAKEWGRVLWSDETKFNLFNPDGQNLVRRPIGTRYFPRYVQPTVKFAGGSLMAWGERPCSSIY